MSATGPARLMSILGLLAAGPSEGTRALCEVAAQVTGMSGAGMMLLGDDGPRGSLCTTDSVSTLIENLQYTLGEGPCVDAHTHGSAVLEPDLADPDVARWPAFAPMRLNTRVCRPRWPA